MKIDIISREVIKPSSPTPPHLKNYKLCLLDEMNAPFYVPIVLFYSPEETPKFNQSEASQLLKTSLSDVLTKFYPIAGTMEGEVSVNCNDQGVDFIEAQVDHQLSDIIQRPDIDVLNQLIPFKLNKIEVTAEKHLAIQANFFSCGGLVLGACFSHRIGDGCTFLTFIKAWAATARGESDLVCPSFDSASYFPARDPLGYKLIPPVPEEGLVIRNLVFSASAIAALKAEASKNNLGLVQPTRVEVVTAFIWKCTIDQTEIENRTTSMVFHPVNIRQRMDPALPEQSFGNLFLMAHAVTDGSETDLGDLVGKVRAGFKKVDIDYIRKRQGEKGYEVMTSNMRRIRQLIAKGEVKLLKCTSWCGFPIYEADFGFGKPSWVSSASMTTRNSVFFMDSKSPGGLEAWVTLHEQDAPVFDQNPDLRPFIS